jgi:glycosyltransferase involved in cell wall biosynthesis
MIRILCLHIASHRPSYRYRVGQFLPHWSEHEIQVDTICVSGRDAPVNIVRSLSLCGEYDYIWIQRKIFPAFLVWMLSGKSKLIFDFDDAIYTKQVMLSNRAGQESRLKLRWIAYTLSKASLVFAGSHDLKVYAERYSPNVHLVPTSYGIPHERYSNKQYSQTITIGWIGTNSNHYFLGIIDEALSTLKKAHPAVRFSIMTGRRPEKLDTPWELAGWSPEAEQQWLSEIDIGIMPLTDDEWSRGKCAFKLLQYMAYGKPVVASNVGANKSVITDRVNGFLVDDSAGWVEALEELISDAALRRKMGEESRTVFSEHFDRKVVQKRIADLIRNDFRGRYDDTSLPCNLLKV